MSIGIRSRPLPTAVKWLGTAFVLFHFFVVGIRVLGSRSGPWPLPDFLSNSGPTSPQEPPEFTKAINEWTEKYYLGPLRLMGEFKFRSNHVMTGDAYFEVKVMSPSGKVDQTLRFPDPDANFLVRHRQRLLAMQLAQDRYLPPLMGERIEAAKQAPKTITYWGPEDGTPAPANGNPVMALHTKPETEAPRNQMLPSPSDGSLIVARSYQRHLARDVAKDRPVEIVRHYRHPVLTMYLLLPAPESAFAEIVSKFRGIP